MCPTAIEDTIPVEITSSPPFGPKSPLPSSEATRPIFILSSPEKTPAPAPTKEATPQPSSEEAKPAEAAETIPSKPQSKGRKTPAKRPPKEPVATPVSTRPSRKRQAPARFVDEIAVPEKQSVKRTKRGGKEAKWDPETVLSSQKSPLVNADLLGMLSLPDAWDCLDWKEKAELLQMLPKHYRKSANPHMNPLQHALKSSVAFAKSVRMFQEDLKEGYRDPEWIRQADEASEMNARGEFDDLDQDVREEWLAFKAKETAGVADGV